MRIATNLVLAGAFILSIFLIPPAASEEEPAAAGATAPPLPGSSHDVALRASHHFGLLEQPTERDLNLLILAYDEQQGLIAPGTYDFARSIDIDQQRLEKAPPQFVIRDAYAVCDLDEDGIDDVVTNEFDLLTGRPSVRALSGADGHNIWIRYSSRYFPPGAIFPGYQPGSALNGASGLPAPYHPENFAPSVDVNDDGICDFLIITMTASQIGIDPVILTVTTDYNMVNGSYGYHVLWTQRATSTTIFTFDPLTGGNIFICVQMIDFPTGFLHFYTANGARWVRKTTDAYYCSAPCVFDWRSNDTVIVHDSRTGNAYWSRDINFTREYNPTSRSQEKSNNITYLMGAIDLAGDDEAEILLSQYQFTTPQTGTGPCAFLFRNPIDGSPLFVYGTSATALTLRGELRGGGADLWKSLVYDLGTSRVNLPVEESFEIVIWIWTQVINDVTGDKVPEVVMTYLAAEVSPSAPTTPNGRFRTHVHPLDGSTGAKLWPKADVRLQGWGFVAGMNADYDTAVPYFAVGTVDLPTISGSTARFPIKDVRLTVLDVKDGTGKWSYREQFAQDSYISYDMTLNQYRSALAPYDWNDDGVRDLVTPSQYVPAHGSNQTLLANSEHKYSVLSGVDGTTLSEARVWGPSGLVIACGANEPTLNVFSGHSRRYDTTRMILEPDVEQVWRFPLFNNPDLAAATAGSDLMFVGPKCITFHDGRTVFHLNLGLASPKRGREVVSLYGVVGDDGEDLDWIVPPVQGKPPISVDEILQYFNLDDTHPSLTLVYAAGPAVPGLLAGLGVARMRRKNGGA